MTKKYKKNNKKLIQVVLRRSNLSTRIVFVSSERQKICICIFAYCLCWPSTPGLSALYLSNCSPSFLCLSMLRALQYCGMLQYIKTHACRHRSNFLLRPWCFGEQLNIHKSVACVMYTHKTEQEYENRKIQQPSMEGLCRNK